MQFAYDSDCLRLVSRDAASIDEVAAILQALDGVLDGTRDGLAWFNKLYGQVTLAVRAQEAGRPQSFISQLDFQFANFYFSALRGWLSGAATESIPESWRILFAQRTNECLARIQFALAGVNAHINRDLAVAVVRTCSSMGIVPQHGSAEYQQYTALNATLDSLIEQAKRELLVRLPGDALPAVNRVEDVVAAWGVAAAREAAWVNSEILAGLSDADTGLAQRFIETMDGTAALAGKALLLAP